MKTLLDADLLHGDLPDRHGAHLEANLRDPNP